MQHSQRRAHLRVITLTTFLAFLVFTSAPPLRRKKKLLTEHDVLDPVGVFYIKEGRDAVPLDEVDRSGVPDRVEDIAKQVSAAHHLFCDVLKFPDPFGSERHEAMNCIQVSLRDLGGGNAWRTIRHSVPERFRKEKRRIGQSSWLSLINATLGRHPGTKRQ